MLATKLKLAVAASLAAGRLGRLDRLRDRRGPEVERQRQARRRRDRPATSDNPRSRPSAPPRRPSSPPREPSSTRTGKPIAGARVILREWSVFRVRGMPHEQTEKIITGRGNQRHADGNQNRRGGPIPLPRRARAGLSADRRGRPERLSVGYRGPRSRPRPGLGPAHAPESAHSDHAQARSRGTLRGRVVEPGGKPVVGAKVQVFGIDPLGQARRKRIGNRQPAQPELVGVSARCDDRRRRPVHDRAGCLATRSPRWSSPSRVTSGSLLSPRRPNVPQPDFVLVLLARQTRRDPHADPHRRIHPHRQGRRPRAGRPGRSRRRRQAGRKGSTSSITAP